MPVYKARKTSMFIFACCVVPIFFVRYTSGILAGCMFDKSGRCCTPGMECKYLYNRFRYFSEKYFKFCDWNCGYGRIRRWNSFPICHRNHPGSFQTYRIPGNRIQYYFWHLRHCLFAGMGSHAFVVSEDAGGKRIIMRYPARAGWVMDCDLLGKRLPFFT